MADWKEVKIKDLGMKRRFYNKIAGKLARLVYYKAKSEGISEVCERIAGPDAKNWDYGNVTLGDIERIGFNAFITIQGVGPATFRDFFQRASDVGMKISLADENGVATSLEMAREIGMFSDFKCFDVMRKSGLFDAKKVENEETRFDNLLEKIALNGIEVLDDFPAEYFDKDSKKFKKIKNCAIDYFQKLKDRALKADSIEEFDALEKVVDAQMTKFSRIVERKRESLMDFEEKKSGYGGKIDEKIRHIDEKYYRTAFKPNHERNGFDLGDF